ncbi:MAG: hypothetical protein HYV09_18285 [Deltaproteobacteria bacterium]|nr:hypothetical protein [Deltaproteobacteria bacterium]
MFKRLGGALAAATVLSAAAIGCGRMDAVVSGQDIEESDVERAELARVGFVPLAPESNTLSSGAMPLGWATEAERRLAEQEFAAGGESSFTPPNAIGGGPSDFED